MQGTLVFVHGTGVRKEGYENDFAAVKDGAQRNGITGVRFVGAPWGVDAPDGPGLGVSLTRLPDVLPPQVVTRAAAGAPPTAAEIEVALWAALLDDPLFELRVGAQAAPQQDAGAVAIGRLPADQVAEQMLAGLSANMPDLTGTGLTAQEVAAAANAVGQSAELHGAALAAGNAADPDLVKAAARAVVATALAGHRGAPPGTEPPIALNGAARDALVARVAEALAPTPTRGPVTDWLKQKVLAFAAPLATARMRDRRADLTGYAWPRAGDIFHYERRGEAIRQWLTDLLATQSRPVVAMGHSLGGVILVDLLSMPNAPQIDLLVTVGSQAPLFFAMDSLGSLRPNAPDVQPFTPWLNIYSRSDLISFCATRIFPGDPRIRDVEVDSGVPFPDSHGAYLHDDRTYQLIREAWGQLG